MAEKGRQKTFESKAVETYQVAQGIAPSTVIVRYNRRQKLSHGELITVSSQISRSAYDRVSEAAKEAGLSVSKFLSGYIETADETTQTGAKVRKVGYEKGSLILRIPRDLSKQVGIQEGSYVWVRKAGPSLIVTSI